MATVIETLEVENGYLQMVEDILTDGSAVFDIRLINRSDRSVAEFNCITKASAILLWEALQLRANIRII